MASRKIESVPSHFRKRRNGTSKKKIRRVRSYRRRRPAYRRKRR